jgi:hypothetical protein
MSKSKWNSASKRKMVPKYHKHEIAGSKRCAESADRFKKANLIALVMENCVSRISCCQWRINGVLKLYAQRPHRSLGLPAISLQH